MKFIDARPLYHFLSTLDEPVPSEEGADVAFILGAGSLGPVRRAAKLYHATLTKYIAFTSAGGNFGGNIVFGRAENEEYDDVLHRLGVPPQARIYPRPEQCTTNTLVEAKGAVPFIEFRIGKVTRIALCSRSVHQRRAWATFQKQHPQVYYVNYPDHEDLTIELLPRMVQEIDRLREYGAKGDLVMQEIPADVSGICEQIRRHLAG